MFNESTLNDEACGGLVELTGDELDLVLGGNGPSGAQPEPAPSGMPDFPFPTPEPQPPQLPDLPFPTPEPPQMPEPYPYPTPEPQPVPAPFDFPPFEPGPFPEPLPHQDVIIG